LARDLARHQPSGDVNAVWLEGRERLDTTEPGIVGHAGRQGELGRAVRPEHQDPDVERVAPSEGVEADHAGCVQDYEATQAVGGPVIAARAPVRADAVVNFECATLDEDSNTEAVGYTYAGKESLGPIAEHVAHVFGKVMDGTYSPVTPLTSCRHRDAQVVVKARKIEATRRAAASGVLQRPAPQSAALPLWTCPDCGGAVTNPRHVRCEACIAADPAQAAEIRGRRGAAIAARKRALSEWHRANPDAVYEPELFRREILPRLATVKLMDIAEAAGCSKASASDIRRGKWAPHVSAWAALAKVTGMQFTPRS
jgi:hypothetical protein